MKAVILAGGLGTRLSEETDSKPKPMVEIGDRPILWHLMKMLSSYGISEFIICCGYKGHVIKSFFNNYEIYEHDIKVNLKSGDLKVLSDTRDDWDITLVDTGAATQTGGRLKRVQKYLSPDEDFLFTYGDGLSDVDIKKLVDFHKSCGKMATVTAVQMPGRFGGLSIDHETVKSFIEKPHGDRGFINGGFFILSPKVIKFIDNDASIWEKEPMEQLTRLGELAAYKHEGFWQPMDTLRDKLELSEMWDKQNAPWKIWI